MFFNTKLINCGRYDCRNHCQNGGCGLGKISLDKDGKCVLFTCLPSSKYRPADEIDEHTNMC